MWGSLGPPTIAGFSPGALYTAATYDLIGLIAVAFPGLLLTGLFYLHP